MPKPIRRLIAVAVLLTLALIAHKLHHAVPAAYRGLPDIVSALLIATSALVVLAPVLDRAAKSPGRY